MSVNANDAALADDCSSYTMSVDIEITTPEDVEASFSLCFNQNPNV